MRLSKAEQETIILYNEAESTATIDTCNRPLIKRLDDLSRKYTTVIGQKSDEYGKTYTVPKSWIKVQPPRQLSDESRQKLRERALQNLVKQ